MPQQATDSTFDLWFVREVFIHDHCLKGFFGKRRIERDEVNDLCQEAYLRVIHSSRISRPRSARGFLFQIARNLLIDRYRQASRNVETSSSHVANDVTDELGPERRVSG